MNGLTYEELVARNDRLARKIISMGDQFQEILWDEVKKSKAKAWDEGYEEGAVHAVGIRAHIDGLTERDPERPKNPYREQQ